jgi:hypothetical protein
MIVVADASPLIFLAKIRRLDVVHRLLGHDIRVPRQVRDEILAPNIDPAEERELQTFLDSCRIEVVRHPRRFASAMSQADNAALTLAVRVRADILLCDDRVTRLMAEAEGIRPLGTLGVLLRALQQGLLSALETRNLVDLLIRSHSFRIGIEVYQAVLAEIESHALRG